MKNINILLRVGLPVAVMLMLMGAVQHAWAVPTNFNIFFDEGNNGSIDWTGTYTIDGGVLTALSADIGICSNPVNCLYSRLEPLPPDFDPANINSACANVDTQPGNGFLDLCPAPPTQFFPPFSWHARVGFTGVDDQEHSGTYTVQRAPVPEPTSAAMLLVGLGVIGYLRNRVKRSSLRVRVR